MSTNSGDRHTPAERRMRVIYVAVILLEVLVVTMLWAFGRYFS